MSLRASNPTGVSSSDRCDAPGTSDGPSVMTPPEELSQTARAIFGDRLELAIRYAEILATDGVERGLIGPREVPRIWERHLFNCAVVSELLPEGARVIDVGSGAGLPGIALALARPDVTVLLVESLARRVQFLTEVIERLQLPRVEVLRARAEECVGKVPPAEVVTARAVAPLDRLTRWCLPLTAPGGRLLALKGESAAEEVAEHREAIRRHGGGEPEIVRCGVGAVEPPTTVVIVPLSAETRQTAPVKRPQAKTETGRGGRGTRTTRQKTQKTQQKRSTRSLPGGRARRGRHG